MSNQIIKENIKEENDNESEYSYFTDSEEEEEEDYSEYVKGWEESYGKVFGEALKRMAMGKYFKNCNIDDEEVYDITFYYNEEDWKDLHLGCMNKCYFSINELSDKVFYVYYNTSSRFAYEHENIYFDDEEEDEEEEE